MELKNFAAFFNLSTESQNFIAKHGFNETAPGLEIIPETLQENFIISQVKKLRRPLDAAPLLQAADELKNNPFLLSCYNYLAYYWHERKDIQIYVKILPEFESNPSGAANSGIYYLLLALAFFPEVEKVYRQLGLPDRYALDTMQYISGALDEYAAGNNGQLGFSSKKLHWLRHYIDGDLFRIGRLEYMIQDPASYLPAAYRRKSDGKIIALCRNNWQLRKDGLWKFDNEPSLNIYKKAALSTNDSKITGIPVNPAGFAEVDKSITLDLQEHTPLWNNWDLVPGIHIPGGGGMTLSEVEASLLEARDFFPRYFNRSAAAFSCASWIFNNDFERELPESNLAKFMREVYLLPFPSCGVEGLQFVFGKADEQWAHYPADNSLRRAFHRLRESGRRLKAGAMFIEARGLENFGQQIYRQDYTAF